MARSKSSTVAKSEAVEAPAKPEVEMVTLRIKYPAIVGGHFMATGDTQAFPKAHALKLVETTSLWELA